MRGRPRKPTAQKILEGKPGHRPLPENEPMPDPVNLLPHAPKGLRSESRKFWREAGADLMRCKTLSRLDVFALEEMARIHSIRQDYIELAAQQRKKSGVEANPKAIQREIRYCNHEILLYMREFGMTPASRARVQMVKGEIEGDEMEKLLAENNKKVISIAG